MDNRAKIKELLKERRMNVRGLAKRVGVAPSTIYRYLNGDTYTLKDDLLARIADVLGVSPYVFYDNDIVSMDVELKANYIKSELVKMQITDDEFNQLEQYIRFLRSLR